MLLSAANKKLEMYSRGREKSNGKVGQYRIETSVRRGCKQASSRVGKLSKVAVFSAVRSVGSSIKLTSLAVPALTIDFL
jgi:hypothetical protein